MKSKLDIRVGDVVRLLDFKVTEVGTNTISGDYVGGSQGYTYPIRYAAEVISRAETDAEKIARLEDQIADAKNVIEAQEADLAKAPRRIEWSGGECPVDCEVIVWFRNGFTKIEEAHSFDWRHSYMADNKFDDIIAYMVLPS